MFQPNWFEATRTEINWVAINNGNNGAGKEIKVISCLRTYYILPRSKDNAVLIKGNSINGIPNKGRHWVGVGIPYLPILPEVKAYFISIKVLRIDGSNREGITSRILNRMTPLISTKAAA